MTNAPTPPSIPQPTKPDAASPAPLTTEERAKARRERAARAAARRFAARIALWIVIAILLFFFALPMSWLVTAPFSSAPSYHVSWPDWTLNNFKILFDNAYAMGSILNSLILGIGTMVIILIFGSLASYALSRVHIPGRDGLLYGLLLLSSIVTGTAAMVPTYQLMFTLGLLNTQVGVILVLAGGLLPTVIFILKDFMDSVPKSYEESARLYGAGPTRILLHVVAPIARPGLAFISVWAIVQVWSNFLVPYILLTDASKQPAAVQMYTFQTEAGQANLSLISAFALLFSVPVIVIYFLVNRRYGFRFHGGIKS